jgi:hypothetical protein
MRRSTVENLINFDVFPAICPKGGPQNKAFLPNLTLDTGCWILDAGYEIRDAGFELRGTT